MIVCLPLCHTDQVVHRSLFCEFDIQCHIGALMSGGPVLVLHGVPWVNHIRSKHPSDLEQES